MIPESRQAAAFAAPTVFHVRGQRRQGETPEAHAQRVFIERERPTPVVELHVFANRYRRMNRLRSPQVPWTCVYVPFIRSRSTAAAFRAVTSTPGRPDVREAYENLERQVDVQFRLLTELLGVSVEFVDEPEPYESSCAQAADVAAGRLKTATISIWPDSHHPLLSNERGGSYDRFRSVHDAFGHVAIGTGFDRHGEFAAWLHHSSMFYGSAQRAASTELTGENSVLACTGAFAEHKAALLPPRFCDTSFIRGGTR